jgi:hypothetical protein
MNAFPNKVRHRRLGKTSRQLDPTCLEGFAVIARLAIAREQVSSAERDRY